MGVNALRRPCHQPVDLGLHDGSGGQGGSRGGPADGSGARADPHRRADEGDQHHPEPGEEEPAATTRPSDETGCASATCRAATASGDSSPASSATGTLGGVGGR